MTDRQFLEDATLKLQSEGIEPTEEMLQYALLKWREKEIPRRQKDIETYGKGLEKLGGFVKAIWDQAERPYNAISNVIKTLGEFTEKIPEDPNAAVGFYGRLGKAFVDGLTQKDRVKLHEWMWGQYEEVIPEEAWVARGAAKTVADITQYYTDPRYRVIGKAINFAVKDLLKSIPAKVKLSPESEKMVKDLPKYKHKPVPKLAHTPTWTRAREVALGEMLPKEQVRVGDIPQWADEGATRWANFIEKYLGKLDAKVSEIRYVTQQVGKVFTADKEQLLVKVLEKLYGHRTLAVGEMAKAVNITQQITQGAMPAAEFFKEPVVEKPTPEPTVPIVDMLYGIHVTDNPDKVLNVLKKGGDISKTRGSGLVGDLGTSGLYFSDAPQLWTGRSGDKWKFLKDLDKPQKRELYIYLSNTLAEQYATHYISETEHEYAMRSLKNFLQTDDVEQIIDLASQPYNIKFWEKDVLKKMGVEQKFTPHQIPVTAVGKFADLTKVGITDELIKTLKAQGFDGAFTKSTMAQTPQMVVWNTDAIKKFGDFSREQPIFEPTKPELTAEQMTVSGVHFAGTPEIKSTIEKEGFQIQKRGRGEYPDPANGIWITTKPEEQYGALTRLAANRRVDVNATIRPIVFETPGELYDYVDPLVGRKLGNVHISQVSEKDPLLQYTNREKVRQHLLKQGYNAIYFGEGFRGASAHNPGDMLILDPKVIEIKPTKPSLTAEQERQIIRQPPGRFEGEKTGIEQLYPTAEKDIMTGEELTIEQQVVRKPRTKKVQTEFEGAVKPKMQDEYIKPETKEDIKVGREKLESSSIFEATVPATQLKLGGQEEQIVDAKKQQRLANLGYSIGQINKMTKETVIQILARDIKASRVTIQDDGTFSFHPTELTYEDPYTGDAISKEEYEFIMGYGEETVWDAIRHEGGIRPYKKSAVQNKPHHQEEYSIVPAFLRSNKGLPLDEMAEILGNNYPHLGITDENTLLEALDNENRARAQGKTTLHAGVPPERMRWDPDRGLTPDNQEIEPFLQDYDKLMIGEPQPHKPSVKNWFSEMYRQIVNRAHPVDVLSRAVSKMGIGLRPGEDPAILYRRIYGAKAIAESKLFWNTTALNKDGELEITGPGLQEIIAPFARNEQDIKRLMIAHRDLELAAREDIKGTKALWSQEVIKKIRLKYGPEKFQKLLDVTAQIRQWQIRTTLDPLLEVGALSQEQYSKIIESNQFYVPFNRVIEELEEYGAVRSSANLLQPGAFPLQKIKGSERYLKDPFETMINRVYQVSDFVERQRTLNAIVNLRYLSPEIEKEIHEIDPSSALPKISVFENGERKYFHVPEDLHKAIKQLDIGDMGTLWRLLGVPAKTLRAGATMIPEFFGRNIIRDQMTGFVYSKYGYIPFVDFAPGIFNAIGKTDMYWRWAASGGAHAALVSLDKYMANKKLYEVMGGKDFGKYIRSPLKALQELSELGEAGTRVGAYGRARAKGAPDVLAALESRELTLDFAQRGAATKAINQLIAFWNANVLGMDKIARAHIRNPVRTILRALLGITVPSVTLWYINKDNERIQNLPQWQRDLFWCVDLGEGKPILRIPKPFELGLIYGSLPERILDWMHREDPDAVKNWLGSVVQSMMPGMVPTVLAPVLEEKANYSFFMQRQLIPSALKGLPAEFQYTPYTSESAKEAGKLIGKSPVVLENYIWSYSGGLGRHFLKGLDMALTKYDVLKEPSAKLPMELADYPLLKGFVAREPIGLGSDPVNKLYDLYEKSDQAYNAVKKLQQENRGAEVEEYVKKHPEYGLRQPLYDFIYGTPKGNIPSISTLLRYRNQILYSDEYTPIEKKKRLERIDTAITTMAYKIINNIKTGKTD